MTQGCLGKASSFLTGTQRPDGGWGYEADSDQSAPEPSSCCLLALSNSSRAASERGLSWLEARIGSDGGVRYEGDNDVHWTTSLVAFTLVRLRSDSSKLRACVSRLLTLKGTSDKGVGWAWTDGTFSWVEPTCYALLALKAAGQTRHPRVVEAERMLEARACSTGGWNQGLLTVFYEQPTALAVQTALGILALQDRSEWRASIVKAAEFLRPDVGAHPSVLTLAWTVLAMNAIGEDTCNFPAELEKRQEPGGGWRGSNHLTALAVLALQAVKEGRNAFRL